MGFIIYIHQSVANPFNCNECICMRKSPHHHLSEITANCTREAVESLKLLKVFDEKIDAIDFTGQKFTQLFSYMFYNIRLTIIKNVTLTNCEIKDIHKNAFKHMSKLQSLDISNNVIELLDKDTFEDVHHLKILNISHNYIKDINKDLFAHLIYLKTVDLSYNYIIITDNNLLFPYSMHITRIWLNNNTITNIYDNLNNLYYLEFLALHNNPWDCDCISDMLFEKSKKISPISPKCNTPSNLNGREWREITANDFKCNSTHHPTSKKKIE